MASLPGLPAEVLALVATYLVLPYVGFKDNGICALRLTCRDLCLKTQYVFGRAAFSTLRIDFHPESLELLQTICRIPAFGEGVRKLVFAHWGDEYIAFPDGVGEEENLTGLKEQVLFVLKQVLGDAFQGLQKVEEVMIVTPFVARFRRYRGKSLKEMMMMAEDGKTVNESKDLSLGTVTHEIYNVPADQLFKIIVEAAAHTSVALSVTVTSSTLPERRRNYPACTVLDTTLAAIDPGLRNIKSLNLTVLFDPDADKDLGTDRSLSKALGGMVHLIDLDMKLVGAINTYSDPWQPVLSAPHLQGFHLRHLKSLRISQAVIDPDALCAFFVTHRDTLSFVGLHRLGIAQGERWHDVMATLADECSVLNELQLDTLYTGWPWRKFVIRSDERDVFSCRYVGRNRVLLKLREILGM